MPGDRPQLDLALRFRNPAESPTRRRYTVPAASTFHYLLSAMANVASS